MVFLFFRPVNRKTGNCKSNYLFFVNQAEGHPLPELRGMSNQNDPDDLPYDMCTGMCRYGILNAVFAIEVSKDQSSGSVQEKASQQDHRRYFAKHLHC